MGVALGGVDLCTYPMILELCDAGSVGRYAGYFFMTTACAQVVTPVLSGLVMDVSMNMLFAYVALMSAFMCVCLLLSKHGDTITLEEVARREESADAR